MFDFFFPIVNKQPIIHKSIKVPTNLLFKDIIEYYYNNTNIFIDKDQRYTYHNYPHVYDKNGEIIYNIFIDKDQRYTYNKSPHVYDKNGEIISNIEVTDVNKNGIFIKDIPKFSQFL